MRNLLVIVAALFFAGTAAATATQNITTTCTEGERSISCVTRAAPRLNNNAKVIRVPQPMNSAELREAAERDSKWEAFCAPTRHVDDMGVTRLRYAQSGCEFGRAE